MAWLQGSKFYAIMRKKYFRNTPDAMKSGYFRNNNTTSKKLSVWSKNLILEQKCENKVCRYISYNLVTKNESMYNFYIMNLIRREFDFPKTLIYPNFNLMCLASAMLMGVWV